MTSSQVRFGVQTGQQEATWPEIRDAWLELEDLGFDDLWVYDHFLPTGTRNMDGNVPDGWTLMAGLSQVVRRPRIGTLVTSMTFRHPVVLAKAATTLDHMSDGRAILGLGAGWHIPEHTAYDIPFPSPRERVERLGEATHIIKLLWSKERTTFHGKYYHLEDAPFEPKPLQQPHPLIVIGGGGEKQTLRVVARYADEWNWNLASGTAGDYLRKLSILKEYCKEIGRDPSSIALSLNTDFLITEDPTRLEAALKVSAQTAGISINKVKENAIVGNPNEVGLKLQTYIDMGVRSFIFSLRAPFDVAGTSKLPDLAERALRYHTTMDDVRTLSKEVLPALR